MNEKNKIKKISRQILGFMGGLFLLPTQTQASPLSQEGAQAYLEIINGYTSYYGTGKADTNQNGLLQSRLLDMDGDGDLELQVLYVDSGTPTLEFWHFTGSTAEKLYTGHLNEETPFMYGGSVVLSLYEGENKWFFYQQSDGGMLGSGWVDNRVFQYNGTVMTEILNYSVGYPYSEDFSHFRRIGTVNGVSIDENESEGHFEVDWEADFLTNYHRGNTLTIGTCYGGSMPEDHFGYKDMPTTSCVADLQNLATAPPVVEEVVEDVVEETTETAETPLQTAEFSQHTTIPNAYEILAGNYLSVLNYYTEKYGVSNGQSQGLSSSRLIDLDGDGTRELLLTYRKNNASPTTVVTEIWEIQQGQAVMAFQHLIEQEPVSSDSNWRDVLTLGSYQNGYILNFAGGGGRNNTEEWYESYDKIFAYSQGDILNLGNIWMAKFNAAHGFEATINGVSNWDSNAWQTEFKRIQNTYLQGGTTELFYIDQDSVTMNIASAQEELNQIRNEHGGNSGEVLLSVSGTILPNHAQIWLNLIQETISNYGYIEDKDIGYGSSRLVDFDGDGVDELILTYRPTFSLTEDNMTMEIWQIQGDSPVNIFTFKADSNYDNGTKSYSLLPYEGVWGLYEVSSTGNYGDGSSEKVFLLQDQQFQQVFYISSYWPLNDGGAWSKINGATTTDEAFSAERNKLGLQNEELLIKEDYYDVNYTPYCSLSQLELVLTQSQPSNHFFGYPMIYDQEIHSQIGSLDLNGTLLAIYQVDETLFYVIVDVNGKQESHLVQSSDGSFNLLSSHTENLTYDALEEEKGKMQPLSSDGDQSNQSSEKENNQSNNSENNAFLFTWIGLIVVLSTGLLLTLKKMKTNGKS